MADQEEVHYDSTVTKEDETEDGQHRREESSDKGSKPAGSTEVVETMSRTKLQPIAPKPKTQHSQETLERKEDVKVHSKLSGLKTLSINIRLNVADLVQTSTTSRRHRHKKTRHKTVRLVPPAHYEIAELINKEPTDTGKEPVENSMKSIGVETDVFELPPRRPPKTYRTEVNVSDAMKSIGVETEDVFELPPRRPPKTYRTEVNVSDAMKSIGVETEDVFELPPRRPPKTYGTEVNVSDAMKSIGVETEDVFELPQRRPPKAFCTEVNVSDAGQSSKNNSTTEDQEANYEFVASIEPVADNKIPDHDVYSSDTHLTTEVEGLSGTQDWFYSYKEGHKAQTDLSNSEKADGSFAVISENIEENYHFPFTLLLKHRGKITRIPIKRITDYRKKKYELFSTKKGTILKLVEHFRHRPLPHFKLTLK
ncbi:uncharacterized protein LOC123534712 isoform X2 [Mercenaria mercenaria]|uniref:uncharacterized protein LOC123534712 isoform X2 n=1 Tax=Mercenaria mercenaria TaxID=6596 RepID=UPI00234F8143|nr:uncharacterized protein LOC123534712 isoform X2 [Mercenaria mercenaria]